jgi:hypothetical protein
MTVTELDAKPVFGTSHRCLVSHVAIRSEHLTHPCPPST